jgi:ribosomal protein S18 acetylase RimI-like enzyme
MAKTIGIKEVSKTELPILRQLMLQTSLEKFQYNYTEEELSDYFKEEFDLAKLDLELTNPETEIDFLMLNGQAIGYLKINWGSAQTKKMAGNTIEIQRFSILKDFQGQGLEDFLFQYAIDMVTASDYDWIWVEVLETDVNRQEFYSKNGFVLFDQGLLTIADKKHINYLMKKHLR